MMEVQIWSDVRCPFCYIGKKKFEAALERFPQKDQVKVEWKSFQLDPELQTNPELSTVDYFVAAKGVSKEQAEQMLAGGKQMGKDVGLDLDLEHSVLANSFQAHRLIQMAKSKGLGNEIEEALFRAHFEDRVNIDDQEALITVGKGIGMDAAEIRKILESEAFSYEVKQDEMEARNIGVRGVPFFVFNNKYAVSGAQPTEAFLETLEKSWAGYQQQKIDLDIQEGASCSPEGDC